jgi:TRAP-type mannitol/chloroaromatic compound transport system permease small subunit
VTFRADRPEARRKDDAPSGSQLETPAGNPVLTVLRTILAPVRALSVVCAGVAAVTMAALMLLQVVDVVVRNTKGGSAVDGVPEYISVGMVAVVFLSIAHAEKLGAHIRTPVLISRLPGKVGVVVRGAGLIAAVLIIWALAWATLGRAIESYQASEVFSGIARVPAWPARFAIPLGAFLFGVELLARALMLDGEEPEDDDAPMEGSLL